MPSGNYPQVYDTPTSKLGGDSAIFDPRGHFSTEPGCHYAGQMGGKSRKKMRKTKRHSRKQKKSMRRKHSRK